MRLSPVRLAVISGELLPTASKFNFGTGSGTLGLAVIALLDDTGQVDGHIPVPGRGQDKCPAPKTRVVLLRAQLRALNQR